MNQVDEVYGGLLKKLGVGDSKSGKAQDINQAIKAPKLLVPPVVISTPNGDPYLSLSIAESPIHGDRDPMFQIRLANIPEWTVTMSVEILEKLIEALILMESQYEDYCYNRGGRKNDPLL